MVKKRSKSCLVKSCSIEDQTSVCILCKIQSDAGFLGQLFQSKVTVHENCMFFSPLLHQEINPTINRKNFIIGFNEDSIIKESHRNKALRCAICKKSSAGVGCCVPRCKKSFHLLCGIQANCLGLFHGGFEFYCKQHSPKQNLKVELEQINEKEPPDCTICLEPITNPAYDANEQEIKIRSVETILNENELIHGKCCKQCWMHRSCIMRYSISAGLHFTKCPQCGDTNRSFIPSIQQAGIWLPDRDASWELEPGAFQDMYDPPNPVEPTPLPSQDTTLHSPSLSSITGSHTSPRLSNSSLTSSTKENRPQFTTNKRMASAIHNSDDEDPSSSRRKIKKNNSPTSLSITRRRSERIVIKRNMKSLLESKEMTDDDNNYPKENKIKRNKTLMQDRLQKSIKCFLQPIGEDIPHKSSNQHQQLSVNDVTKKPTNNYLQPIKENNSNKSSNQKEQSLGNDVTKKPINNCLQPIKEDVSHKSSNQNEQSLGKDVTMKPINNCLQPIKEDVSHKSSNQKEQSLGKDVTKKPINNFLQPIKEVIPQKSSNEPLHSIDHQNGSNDNLQPIEDDLKKIKRMNRRAIHPISRHKAKSLKTKRENHQSANIIAAIGSNDANEVEFNDLEKLISDMTQSGDSQMFNNKLPKSKLQRYKKPVQRRQSTQKSLKTSPQLSYKQCNSCHKKFLSIAKNTFQSTTLATSNSTDIAASLSDTTNPSHENTDSNCPYYCCECLRDRSTSSSSPPSPHHIQQHNHLISNGTNDSPNTTQSLSIKA